MLYFFMSFFWVYKIKPNEYFFDGDKLRGFTNSSYSLLSQIYWILVIYLFVFVFVFVFLFLFATGGEPPVELWSFGGSAHRGGSVFVFVFVFV